MRRIATLCALLLLTAGASPAAEPTPPTGERGAAGPAEPVSGEGPVGEWLGALDVGPMDLRIALHVERAGDGSLSAGLESIDQGGTQIPVESISFDGRSLRLAVPSIGASYHGTMNEDGSVVEGTWTQGGRSLPLTFHRLRERFVAKRPQHPEPPFPYASEEVRFRSEAGNVELVGTLVVPEGEGPFPAVAMVSGSGPQDRDETLMGHKPFLVLADSLARRGIASLRWDDRGAGESGGDHTGSTVQEFAADAEAAVTFLASRSRIDRSAIGILGHSEGGLTGPMVAAGNDEVDFLVLLAAPGVPMRSLLLRQTRDISRGGGLDGELLEKALAMQEVDLALVADPSLGAEELETKLRALVEKRRESFTAEELERMQVTDEAIEQGIRLSTTPWFRSLIRQDPAIHLQKVEVPVLALFGEKDIQVAAEENAAAVREALAAGENPDADVRVLSGLNHLFQPAQTGGIEEYGAIETTIDPEVLEIVGDWILKQGGRAERQKGQNAEGLKG